jgi:hypothetical protein
VHLYIWWTRERDGRRSRPGSSFIEGARAGGSGRGRVGRMRSSYRAPSDTCGDVAACAAPVALLRRYVQYEVFGRPAARRLVWFAWAWRRSETSVGRTAAASRCDIVRWDWANSVGFYLGPDSAAQKAYAQSYTLSTFRSDSCVHQLKPKHNKLPAKARFALELGRPY